MNKRILSMGKRMLTAFISLCMVVVSLMFPMSVSADNQTFVVLGDSISTGYGLTGYTNTPQPTAEGSYASLVAAGTGMTAINSAVDGLTSAQLAVALSTPTDTQKAAIKSAKAICITIGGNDLLGEFFAAMAKELGVAEQDKIMSEIATAISGDSANVEKLTAALTATIAKVPTITKDFSENLTAIITSIRAMNPKSPILLQTIANPYRAIPNTELVAAVDSGISAINTVISGGAATGTYTVVDVYTAFKDSNATLTNATNPATPFDPHPNADGHKLIAATITKLLPAVTPLAPVTTNPQTGDATNIVIPMILAVCSISWLTLVGIKKKRA